MMDPKGIIKEQYKLSKIQEEELIKSIEQELADKNMEIDPADNNIKGVGYFNSPMFPVYREGRGKR